MILKSLRLRKDLSGMLNSLVNHEEISIKDWKLKEIRGICSFFVKNGFCEEYGIEVDQLRAVAIKVNKMYEDKRY